MRAPLPPLALVRAPSLRFASDFCLFTSCVEPKDADAGRFSPDIVALVVTLVPNLWKANEVSNYSISGAVRSEVVGWFVSECIRPTAVV